MCVPLVVAAAVDTAAWCLVLGAWSWCLVLGACWTPKMSLCDFSTRAFAEGGKEERGLGGLICALTQSIVVYLVSRV